MPQSRQQIRQAWFSETLADESAKPVIKAGRTIGYVSGCSGAWQGWIIVGPNELEPIPDYPPKKSDVVKSVWARFMLFGFDEKLAVKKAKPMKAKPRRLTAEEEQFKKLWDEFVK